MSVTDRKRACPVCGCIESSVLFRQSFEEFTDVSSLTGYEIVSCTNCGAAFADRIPDQSWFEAYYRDQSKYEHEHRGGRESDADARRYHETAATIAAAVCDSSLRVLEVGCATAGLLNVLRSYGFGQVEGLDPSSVCARRARELYGISVSTGSIFEPKQLQGKFDLILIVAVLEHVEDLAKALSSLGVMLSPDGNIYAEVPDASRFASRPDAPFQEFSIEHINFFSPSSLTSLFIRNGFTPMQVGRSNRSQDGDTICPTAHGFFARGETVSGTIEYDRETRPNLQEYIAQSAAVDRCIREKIVARAGARQIVVWGAGTHTRRLLAMGAFDQVSVRAFVDSNPKLQGSTLHGRPVLRPAELYGLAEPILISTRGFEREIRDKIRNELSLPNELILLYEEANASAPTWTK